MAVHARPLLQAFDAHLAALELGHLARRQLAAALALENAPVLRELPMVHARHAVVAVAVVLGEGRARRTEREREGGERNESASHLRILRGLGGPRGLRDPPGHSARATNPCHCRPCATG